MKNLIGKWGVGSAAIALALGVAPAAQALEFSFSSTGWERGGELVGSFSGDVGNDGILSLDELDAFEAVLNGDRQLRGFSVALNDLDSFSFNTDSSFLSFEVLQPDTEVEFRSSGPGSILDDSFGATSELRSNITFTVTQVGGNEPAVPTPAAVLPGLLGMGLSAIRKRKDDSSEAA